MQVLGVVANEVDFLREVCVLLVIRRVLLQEVRLQIREQEDAVGHLGRDNELITDPTTLHPLPDKFFRGSVLAGGRYQVVGFRCGKRSEHTSCPRCQ